MVVEVKPFPGLPFLKLTTLIIFSEHQQPQIDGTSSDAQSAVILRNQDSAVAQLDSAAGRFYGPFFFRAPSSSPSILVFLLSPMTIIFPGQFLLQRTYQGLDMRIGQDAPSVLEQGRSGVARGYKDDIDRLS